MWHNVNFQAHWYELKSCNLNVGTESLQVKQTALQIPPQTDDFNEVLQHRIISSKLKD